MSAGGVRPTPNATLLLRKDGSIQRCDDGSVILQFADSMRFCTMDPIQNREFLIELFGPEVFNACIGTGDGSSGSGLCRRTIAPVWNETTVKVLIKSLKVYKEEFVANRLNESLYKEIANMVNIHDFEFVYTPTACQEKIDELTKDYSYQLFKNCVFEDTSNEGCCEYFDELHEMFGEDFPASTLYARPPNQVIEEKFNLMRNELKTYSKTILRNQKVTIRSQRRTKRALLQFERLVADMRNEQAMENGVDHE